MREKTKGQIRSKRKAERKTNFYAKASKIKRAMFLN